MIYIYTIEYRLHAAYMSEANVETTRILRMRLGALARWSGTLVRRPYSVHCEAAASGHPFVVQAIKTSSNFTSNNVHQLHASLHHLRKELPLVTLVSKESGSEEGSASP